MDDILSSPLFPMVVILLFAGARVFFAARRGRLAPRPSPGGEAAPEEEADDREDPDEGEEFRPVGLSGGAAPFPRTLSPPREAPALKPPALPAPAPALKPPVPASPPAGKPPAAREGGPPAADFPGRLAALSPLQRAVALAEILGPPRGLL
jgi:hypothetical protein